VSMNEARNGETEEFLQKIRAGGKIEPWDWMPDEYRALNLKVIEMNANSELTGALLDGEWISRAPTLWRKRTLAAKVQDEIGHAHLIYRVAETLGRPRRQMYEDLVQRAGVSATTSSTTRPTPGVTWPPSASWSTAPPSSRRRRSVIPRTARTRESCAASTPRSRCTTGTVRTSCWR
jgi:hypothetical protein